MKELLCFFLFAITASSSIAEKQEGFVYIGSYAREAKGRAAAATTSHYYISLSAADWYTADFLCKTGLNSNLVAIEDAAENAALKNLMSLNRALNVDFWTSGYYDTASRAFLWESTGAFVEVDSFGQFINYVPSNQYYLTVRSDRSSTFFNTWHGEESMRYICESQS